MQYLLIKLPVKTTLNLFLFFLLLIGSFLCVSGQTLNNFQVVSITDGETIVISDDGGATGYHIKLAYVKALDREQS